MDINKDIADILGREDLDGIELQERPEGDDVTIVRTAENAVEIGYLTRGEAYGDFWEDEGAGEFRRFRTQTDRDAHIEDKRAEGLLALIVDRYEHGNVHYSVANTANYPDRQWDVAPSGVLVPHADVQERYRSEMAAAAGLAGDERARAEKAAMDNVVADSNTVLQTYSDWCNGEIYDIVIEKVEFSADGGVAAHEHEYFCGHIGIEDAVSFMKDEMSAAFDPQAPSP